VDNPNLDAPSLEALDCQHGRVADPFGKHSKKVRSTWDRPNRGLKWTQKSDRLTNWILGRSVATDGAENDAEVGPKLLS
jgi:hypothetical protein